MILGVKEWHRREGVPVCVISQPELPVTIVSTSTKGRASLHFLVLALETDRPAPECASPIAEFRLDLVFCLIYLSST